MKKLYFMLLSAVFLAFAGCTKDATSDGTGNSDKDKSDDYVYLNVSMQLPLSDGLRSSTDWDDEDKPGNGNTNSDADTDSEEGLDYENTVKTVLLVIASTDDTYITHAEVTGLLKSGSSGLYTINAKFKREDIDKTYTDGLLSNGPKVKMYAYVNYTSNLHDLFSRISASDIESKAWLNWSGEIVERPSRAGQTPIINNTIWAKHSFLMTNATMFTASFPELAADWDQYASEKNPYEVKDGASNETGVIKVERAAARIDFKDASALGNNTYSIIGNVANVQDENTQQGLNLVNVQLTRMSLINMSKNFYYLRRVSAGYGEEQKIGKYETKNNYVVDTDWDAKQATKGITPENAADYFNFTLYGDTQHEDHYPYNRPGWYTDNIAEIVKNTSDKWNDKSYHIWRYVTENTLPDVNSQKTVQSTGVVFKGLILPGKDIKAEISDGDNENNSTRYLSDKVEKALIASSKHLPKKGTGKDAEGNNDFTSTNTPWNGENAEDITDDMSYEYPTLYEFDGLIYAGFDEVVARAVLEGQGSLLYAAAQHILDHWVLEGSKFVHKAEPAADDTKLTVRIYNEINNGAEHVEDGTTDYTEGYSIELDETDEAFKAYATTFNDPEASNFTIYEVSYEDKETENGEGWGYYCYYFYWNRHNDNQLNGKMGPMEFAIVRNNVYKLSVSKINRLGHPRNPDNDPDPYDPEDPDEEDRVYMTINLEVLPWVVRVNEIEF